MTIPTYLPFYVFGGTLAIVAVLLYGLNRALAEANWASTDTARAVRGAAIILIGWLLAAVAIGGAGVYDVQATELPTIQFGILLPILIGAVMIWRSDATRRILEAVPQSWLVRVQLYRALGIIFLILYATGRLPALFAWPAGIGDIAIGLAAPLVGLAYARAPRKAAGMVAGWNVLGILDLIVAVGAGFATAPSLLQPIVVTPSSQLMTVLPMVLIPVYLVPLSIVLHLASLAKLRREAVAPDGRHAFA